MTGERSLNVATGIKQISLIDDIPTGVETVTYDIERGIDVKPWLLLLALLLVLFDLAVSYVLRGLGPRRQTARAAGTAGAMVIGIVTLTALGTVASAP